MNPSDTHIFWLMLVSVLCIGASTVLAYMSRWEAVVLAYVAMLTASISGYAYMGASLLLFWGGATVVVLAINALLPTQVRTSRVGLPYFCTGAIVGMALGMMLNSSAGIICGSAIGVVLAALACSRLTEGRQLDFPSRRFFNYLCAKGLPLVVIFSMAGICILLLISSSRLSGI